MVRISGCGQCCAPEYGEREAMNGVAAAPSPQSVITHTIDGSARIGANDHSDMIVVQITKIRPGGHSASAGIDPSSIRRRGDSAVGTTAVCAASVLSA